MVSIQSFLEGLGSEFHEKHEAIEFALLGTCGGDLVELLQLVDEFDDLGDLEQMLPRLQTRKLFKHLMLEKQMINQQSQNCAHLGIPQRKCEHVDNSDTAGAAPVSPSKHCQPPDFKRLRRNTSLAEAVRSRPTLAAVASDSSEVEGADRCLQIAIHAQHTEFQPAIPADISKVGGTGTSADDIHTLQTSIDAQHTEHQPSIPADTDVDGTGTGTDDSYALQIAIDVQHSEYQPADVNKVDAADIATDDPYTLQTSIDAQHAEHQSTINTVDDTDIASDCRHTLQPSVDMDYTEHQSTTPGRAPQTSTVGEVNRQYREFEDLMSGLKRKFEKLQLTELEGFSCPTVEKGLKKFRKFIVDLDDGVAEAPLSDPEFVAAEGGSPAAAVEILPDVDL